VLCQTFTGNDYFKNTPRNVCFTTDNKLGYDIFHFLFRRTSITGRLKLNRNNFNLFIFLYLVLISNLILLLEFYDEFYFKNKNVNVLPTQNTHVIN